MPVVLKLFTILFNTYLVIICSWYRRHREGWFWHRSGVGYLQSRSQPPCWVLALPRTQTILPGTIKHVLLCMIWHIWFFLLWRGSQRVELFLEGGQLAAPELHPDWVFLELGCLARSLRAQALHTSHTQPQIPTRYMKKRNNSGYLVYLGLGEDQPESEHQFSFIIKRKPTSVRP